MGDPIKEKLNKGLQDLQSQESMREIRFEVMDVISSHNIYSVLTETYKKGFVRGFINGCLESEL